MSKALKWFAVGFMVLVITLFVLLAINLLLPPGWKLSAEILLVLASIVLSLAFTYAPFLRVAFATLSSVQKVYINLGLVTLLSIFMFAGTCTSWLPIAGIECTQAGLKTLLIYIFLAAGGNQLMYVASVQPADVIEAKITRVG